MNRRPAAPESVLLYSQLAVDLPLHREIKNRRTFNRRSQVQELHIGFQMLFKLFFRRNGVARKGWAAGAVGFQGDRLTHVQVLGEDLRRLVFVGEKNRFAFVMARSVRLIRPALSRSVFSGTIMPEMKLIYSSLVEARRLSL